MRIARRFMRKYSDSSGARGIVKDISFYLPQILRMWVTCSFVRRDQ
jgi:hypothetical protein